MRVYTVPIKEDNRVGAGLEGDDILLLQQTGK